MHRDPLMARLSALAAVLALCVVVLGAWVRLSDAGLGCPDWPGCYGRIGVPAGSAEVEAANRAWPERPVDVVKAWKEVTHRYAAGALGLLGVAAVVAVFVEVNALPGAQGQIAVGDGDAGRQRGGSPTSSRLTAIRRSRAASS